MKVRALKPITYNRQRYLKGDVFDVSPFFAKPLIVLGKIVPEAEEEHVNEVTAAKPRRSRRPSGEDVEGKPRRQYRRRDMQAEA